MSPTLRPAPTLRPPRTRLPKQTERSLANAIAISAGNGHTCALRSDGGAACWGNGELGQLGSSRIPYATEPGLVVWP